MSRLENRSKLMKYFSAEQRNTVWSWCAVNEDEKAIYLSVWTDHLNKFGDRGRRYYTIQEPDWGIDRSTGSVSAARADHDEKLRMVFEENYQAYGYFIEAKDRNALPREIESTKTSFIFLLELEKLKDGTVIGYPTQRIEVK